MDKFKKFLSRKFFVAVITAVALAINSNLSTPLDPETIRNIVYVVAAYLFGQTAVDVASVIKNGKSA